jgi:hypothetical protein
VFESRLQTAQLCLFAAGGATIAAVFILIGGPVAAGLLFLVIGNGFAALGCGLYADTKSYPIYLGVALGVGFGIMAALFLYIMPDQSEESAIQEERRMARRGARKSRRTDPGYEVLDDE